MGLQWRIFFENPEFLDHSEVSKKYTSWTTLLMKQLNLPPLPTPTLYHRHTQPGSCLLTDASEAAEHDDDLRCAGRGEAVEASKIGEVELFQ